MLSKWALLGYHHLTGHADEDLHDVVDDVKYDHDHDGDEDVKDGTVKQKEN